jgi:hypothetical protein
MSENRDPEVEVKRTPLTAREYARAMLKAWKNRLGTFPTKGQLGCLYGQFMVETSGTHVWNNNLGNIKEIPNDGLPYMSLRGVWEIINGKREELPKTHPGSRFTAFETLDQGADWYLKKLRTRFASSWPAIEKGDPDAFARALKQQNYYTADVDTYARLLRTHWHAWMKSTAYDEAIRDLLEALEAPTEPVHVPSRRPPQIEDFAIVHPKIEFAPKVYVDLDQDPDDEPPEAA